MILSSPTQIENKPRRIISLVPSITELLSWLQLELETVAITKFCVHPEPWFRNKVRIGGTKKLNVDKIKTLLPQVIIANKEENVKEQVETLAKDQPVWVTDVNNYIDALNMIRDVGDLTHTREKATHLVDYIQASVEEAPARALIPALYLIWKDPFMTVGGDTFINSMMEIAGFQNVYSGVNRYPQVTLEEIKSSSAEIILLSSEPYPFAEEQKRELELLVPGKKILLVDGEMFSWYGSRMLAAIPYFQHLHKHLHRSGS